MTDDEHNSGDDRAGDEAIEWWVRLRAGKLTHKEQAAFDFWLVSDPNNAAAFDEVLRMCGKLTNLRSSSRWNKLASAPRQYWLAGVGALAAAVFTLFIGFDELYDYLHADYYAGVGPPKLVTLDDGSHVQLDARSAIKVNYAPGERRLTLIEGEAWFQVAPDPARPFVVESAGATIIALGTAFDVALEKTGARVTVTEHRVNIFSGGRDVVVEEGEESSFNQNAAATPPSHVDVETVTAWRNGMLIIEKQPLGDVLESLGRYHRGYVFCASPAICDRRVTGVFGTDDPLQALREIEASLGLHAVHLTNYLVLLF
ncbi:MAG TPA: FecR family protein [Bradyrhizobium sp.]|nr:FecR family protein [Bradyrhizobium sp.]